MKNKKVVPIWLSVLLLILVAASLVVSIWNLILFDFSVVSVIYILNILIDLCAVYYCMKGYSKSAAVVFKAMVICMLLTACYSCLLFSSQLSTMVAGGVKFIFSILIVILLAVFAFAKDIGKKKSLTLGILLIVFRFSAYGLEIVTNSDYFLSLNSIIGFINGIVYIIFLLMIIAKYKDKEARGAK